MVRRRRTALTLTSSAAMSHHHPRQHSHPGAGGGGVEGFIEVKSKFDAEFRRFSLDKAKYNTFEKFERLLEQLHLGGAERSDPSTPFVISYTDPKDNDQLPINNTDNYLRALQASRSGSYLVDHKSLSYFIQLEYVLPTYEQYMHTLHLLL